MKRRAITKDTLCRANSDVSVPDGQVQWLCQVSSVLISGTVLCRRWMLRLVVPFQPFEFRERRMAHTTLWPRSRLLATLSWNGTSCRHGTRHRVCATPPLQI